MISRRKALQFLLTLPLAGAVRAATLSRVAVLDWGLLETVLALGIVPAAASAPNWYRRVIGFPTLPASVRDTGLLFQPNLEVLYRIRPDIILIAAGQNILRPRLESIAPVIALPTGGLDGSTAATLKLGALLNRADRAAEVISAMHGAITLARQSAMTFSRPVFLAQPIDLLHLRLFGKGSLLGDVMEACGMTNAWKNGFSVRGDALAELSHIAGSDAVIIVLTPEASQRGFVSGLANSTLWKRLPLTSGKNIMLPKNCFSDTGALVTAGRIADMLGSLSAEWRHG